MRAHPQRGSSERIVFKSASQQSTPREFSSLPVLMKRSQVWRAFSAALSCLRPLWSLLSEAWAKLAAGREAHRERSLRVLETVALGEKRFVSILQVQHARFLIAGGPTGVSLLARLEADATGLGEQLGEQPAGPAFAAVSLPGSAQHFPASFLRHASVKEQL